MRAARRRVGAAGSGKCGRPGTTTCPALWSDSLGVGRESGRVRESCGGCGKNIAECISMGKVDVFLSDGLPCGLLADRSRAFAACAEVPALSRTRPIFGTHSAGFLPRPVATARTRRVLCRPFAVCFANRLESVLFASRGPFPTSLHARVYSSPASRRIVYPASMRPAAGGTQLTVPTWASRSASSGSVGTLRGGSSE